MTESRLPSAKHLDIPCRVPLTLNAQLYGSVTPVSAVIMPLIRIGTCPSTPLQRLFFSQTSQNSENHRRTRIQLNPHQSVSHRVRDVFEMHRGPFDQDSDGYHG